MKRRRVVHFIGLLCFAFPFVVHASPVLDAYKYAWSNNGGYINFANMEVDSSGLTGYAWSENFGWINLSPAQGGVSNDGYGNLSGSAWGEQTGWIDFENVVINTDGKLTGTASGDVVGTITFDCGYCDVRSEWLGSTAPVSASTGGKGAIGANTGGTAPPPTPTQVTVRNEPLTLLAGQEGVLTQDVSTGQVVIEVPAADAGGAAVFTVYEERLISTNAYLVLGNVELVNGVFYHIEARDADGNELHSFDEPLTITLPMPRQYKDEATTGVYWLDESNQQWVLIPNTDFSEGGATFQIDHLTRLAILRTVGEVGPIPPAVERPPAATVEPPKEQGQRSAEQRPISGPPGSIPTGVAPPGSFPSFLKGTDVLGRLSFAGGGLIGWALLFILIVCSPAVLLLIARKIRKSRKRFVRRSALRSQ